jgi:hypothetical protein
VLTDPQHIKQYISTAEFNLLERGEKTCTLRPTNLNLRPGDLISFVETEEDENPDSATGRVVTRRITHIEKSQDGSFSKKEVDLYGLSILSLSPPEQNTLTAVFSEFFTMGIVVEKDGEDWNAISDPTYWPMLICPEIESSGILGELKIESWPEGVYSIHLKIEPTIKEEGEPIELSIVDAFILVMGPGPEGAERNLEGHEVDVSALILGRAISPFGGEIEVLHPSKVKEYYAEEMDGYRHDDETIPVDLSEYEGELDKEAFEDAVIKTIQEYGEEKFFEDYEEPPEEEPENAPR